MKTKTEIESLLAHCHGSESYTKLGGLYPNFYLTDGVILMAENCEAFWLITDSVPVFKSKNEPFAKVELTKNADGSADVLITDGNNTELHSQHYEHTDFPLNKIELFIVLGSLDGKNEHFIVMLPSEY